jgi:succinate dehydrogenase hydrophobic anchor subunit
MEHALHKFRTTTHSRGNTLLVYAYSAVVLMFYGVNTLGVHFFNATNILSSQSRVVIILMDGAPSNKEAAWAETEDLPISILCLWFLQIHMSFGVEEYQGINLYSSVNDLPPSLHIKGPYIIG